jgi:DNA polymerase-1
VMTTSSSFSLFNSVWVIDTEFRSPSGERNEPVCLCALELRTGRRLELFFDQPHDNPFDYADSLFVCYNAAAEWETFITLGWGLPTNIVDLYFEYLNRINGVWFGNICLRKTGSGLADAMDEYGLDGMSHEKKDEARDYILSHSSYPPEGQRRILDYCWTDVDGTAQLFKKMLDDLDLGQALLRGAYSKPVAWMESNGLPVSPVYRQVEEHRAILALQIAREVEATHHYGVYQIVGKINPRPVFKRKGFEALVHRMGLAEVWPLTAKGHFSTNDDKVFRQRVKLFPELSALRQARKSLKSLNLFGARIGSDNRNRASIWPFGTVTGRNSPKTSEFILNRPHWVRNLIAPIQGRALVYADIVAAEVGIAADASGDPEMIRIYNSKLDPYLEFAKSAGALSPDAVRDKLNRPDIEQVRNLYKVADLAIKYGIGAATLASNLGLPLWQADRIIASHKQTYATYWAWAEAQIEQAYRVGYISTAFGWTMAVERSTNRNTVLNFPQQAACAELLRLTFALSEERGLGPYLCAPHHDAFYLECADDDANRVSMELESCFHDSADVVLSGRVQLRLDTHILRYPDHYQDEDGQEIWNIVMRYLVNQGGNEVARADSFAITRPAG